MDRVNIHIFEDRDFPNRIDGAGNKCRQVVREAGTMGYCFEPHDIYWPDITLISTAELFYKAVHYVSNTLSAEAVLFVDLKIGPPDNPSSVLTDAQRAEIGYTPNSNDSIPGLYLTWKALNNPHWDGVIVLASSAADDDMLNAILDLPTWTQHRNRVYQFNKAFWSARNQDGLDELLRNGMDAFLNYKGVMRPPLVRLEAEGWKTWF